MWNCSWGSKTDRQRIASIAWSYCMRCSGMWLPKGGKRQNASSAEATWQTLPQLNPEASIPAVQLVGPDTTKEELLELYLEVYKLHRQPGSPPGEPAVLEEVLSSLPDHQRCEEDKAPTTTAQPHAEGPHPSRSSIPHRGRKDDSVERKSGHSV